MRERRAKSKIVKSHGHKWGQIGSFLATQYDGKGSEWILRWYCGPSLSMSQFGGSRCGLLFSKFAAAKTPQPLSLCLHVLLEESILYEDSRQTVSDIHTLHLYFDLVVRYNCILAFSGDEENVGAGGEKIPTCFLWGC